MPHGQFLRGKKLMTEGGSPLINRTDTVSGCQNEKKFCKACFLDNSNQSTRCVGSCISVFVRGKRGATSESLNVGITLMQLSEHCSLYVGHLIYFALFFYFLFL